MTKRDLTAGLLGLATIGAVAACTPTVKVQVDPINIYAKRHDVDLALLVRLHNAR